jgi:hypothetical protein
MSTIVIVIKRLDAGNKGRVGGAARGVSVDELK